MEVIQVSLVKPVGMVMSVSSTTPVAGTENSGSVTIVSGLIDQPSGHATAGCAAGSPSGAPLSAQETSVAISSCVRHGSFAKCPKRGSAGHGGILRDRTAALIALAHGRVVS